MKTTQLICQTEAQTLKLKARKIGFLVTFKKKPDIIAGDHVLIILEGTADQFLKLARIVRPDEDPKLFSSWSAGCDGRIKRLRRILRRATILPSEMEREMRAKGCSEITIINTRKYLMKQLVYRGACRLSVSYPYGGQDRLIYYF